MAFWKHLWGKENQPVKDKEWQEIVVEDMANPAREARPPMVSEKEIADAIAGRANPLEAQKSLDTFTSRGWDAIGKQTESMAKGKILATPWALGEIFQKYPEESSALLLEQWQDLPVKNGLVLLLSVGKGREDQVVDCISLVINTLDEDDLSTAFGILSRYPTEKAKALLGSYLSHDNWKIVMKTAKALESANAKEYLPHMRVAAEKDGILGAGLQEIVKRME